MNDSPTAKRLRSRLSDPVHKDEIADVLGVSLGTVYESLRRFRAAHELGDEEAMRRAIPCISMGSKGARFIVPREAFIRWYESAGLAPELIERLYGEGAA